MKLNRLVLGPVQTNCYILCDEESGEAAVIDPAYNAEAIKSAADKDGCEIKKIILTHGHYDHTGGLNELMSLCPEAKLYAHLKGKEILADTFLNLSGKPGRTPETFTPDILVSDGDTIPFGSSNKFEVIYTPGHTFDSMCLKFGEVIFCGDTVFRFSVGRTDLPTGSMDMEIKSIKTKLMLLDDNIILYPGHGEYSTIGDERKYNPYIGG